MTVLVLCAFAFLIAVIGACFGSFLNVVIWRVPEKMSLSSPPSHCPKCGSPVRWFDNIPIFSWFILKGKCRSCHAPISFRYPMVEGMSCLVAFLVGVGILFCGWQGNCGQAIRWDRLADDFSHCVVTLQQAQEPAPSAQDVVLNPDNVSIVVDDFIHLLFLAVALSIFWTILADAALMLGFVQYDKEIPPQSLLIATLTIEAIGLGIVYWLNREDASQTGARLLTFAASILLGAIPALAAKKEERFCVAVIGSVWGVASGLYLALPGAALCMAIAEAIRRKTGRRSMGIVVFAATTLLLALESVVALVD